MTYYKARLRLHGENHVISQDFDYADGDSMTNYEITTGTYKEDLLDFNIIKMINSRRDANLPVDFFEIETRIIQRKMSDIIALINKKGGAEITNNLCYSIHVKNIAEMFCENIIIGFFPNFDLKTMSIQGYGDPDSVAHYRKIFGKIFPNKSSDIKMSWYYSSGRGMDSTDIPIETADISVRDSFYPFITEGVDSYLGRFHTSKNSILLLTGEPGTGKTSLIRYYLASYGLDSIVTYDENIMQRDDFYINFLTNSKKHILIVEDADLLLLARENGENKIMSKFLNVSDGLVKSLNKKIIFSTNITELAKIDSAVIRPGRCFDVLEFRKLTLDEANVICEEENMDKLDEARSYTLADIFNRRKKSANIVKTGFF